MRVTRIVSTVIRIIRRHVRATSFKVYDVSTYVKIKILILRRVINAVFYIRRVR